MILFTGVIVVNELNETHKYTVGKVYIFC